MGKTGECREGQMDRRHWNYETLINREKGKKNPGEQGGLMASRERFDANEGLVREGKCRRKKNAMGGDFGQCLRGGTLF